MALIVQSLNFNKIDYYFFETFIYVSDIFIIFIKYDIKTFGLIFYWVFVKVIYPFFVSFLVIAIG